MFKKLLTKLIFGLLCCWQFNAYAGESDDNKKVVMLLSAHDHGFWAGEVIDAYEVLKKESVEVTFATPDGTVGIPNGMWTLDQSQSNTYRELAQLLATPLSLKKLNHADFDAIYIPGGAGPMFDLYNHPTVNTFVKNLYQTNKPIAALCHGPAALAGVRLDNGKLLIEGKKVTGKSNAEEDDWARKNYAFMLEDQLKNTGGLFSAAAPQKPWVVQDGLILTGQNPASTTPLTELFVQNLRK